MKKLSVKEVEHKCVSTIEDTGRCFYCKKELPSKTRDSGKVGENKRIAYQLGVKEERQLWIKKGKKLIEGVCGGSSPTQDNEWAFGFITGLEMILDSRDLRWNPPKKKS
mgnify:CR=1 FL=1